MDTTTNFAGETEDFEEDCEMEGPWTRWDPKVLPKEFYQLT